MNRMHSSKIIVVIIALVGMICCFTPWAQILFFGRSGKVIGIHFAEGLFCLAYFSIIATITLVSDHKASWSKKMLLGISISAVVPAALTAGKIISFQSQASKFQGFNIDINNYVIYNPAIGLYITLTSVISIVLMVLLSVLRQQKPVRITSAWPATQPSGRFFISVSN